MTKKTTATKDAVATFVAVISFSLGVLLLCWRGACYVPVPRGCLSYNLSMITTVTHLFQLPGVGVLISEMSCCIDWLA